MGISETVKPKTKALILKQVKSISPEKIRMLEEFHYSGTVNGESMKGNMSMVQTKVQLPMGLIQYYFQYRNEVRVTAINTVADVKKWFKELLTIYDLSFHPDDPFEGYGHSEGNPRKWVSLYTPKQAKAFNKMMNDAFKACKKENKDIYSVGLKIMQKR